MILDPERGTVALKTQVVQVVSAWVIYIYIHI